MSGADLRRGVRFGSVSDSLGLSVAFLAAGIDTPAAGGRVVASDAAAGRSIGVLDAVAVARLAPLDGAEVAVAEPHDRRRLTWLVGLLSHRDSPLLVEFRDIELADRDELIGEDVALVGLDHHAARREEEDARLVRTVGPVVAGRLHNRLTV